MGSAVQLSTRSPLHGHLVLHAPVAAVVTRVASYACTRYHAAICVYAKLQLFFTVVSVVFSAHARFNAIPCRLLRVLGAAHQPAGLRRLEVELHENPVRYGPTLCPVLRPVPLPPQPQPIAILPQPQVSLSTTSYHVAIAASRQLALSSGCLGSCGC